MAHKSKQDKLMNKMALAVKKKTEETFYEFMQLIIDMKKSMIWQCGLEKPDVFNKYENFIFDKFISLDKLICLAEKERGFLLDEITLKMRELEKELKPLYLYSIELDKYSDILKYYDALHDFDGMTAESYNEKELASDCLRFLNYGVTEHKTFDFIGKIFSVIPFKMTRDKYYDIIARSFIYRAEALDEEQILKRVIKLGELFFPLSSADYSDVLPEMYNGLKEMRELLCAGNINDNLHDILDIEDELIEHSDTFMEYATILYSAYNKLMLMFTNADETELIINENIDAKDIYLSIKEYSGTDDFEAYDETLIDKVAETAFKALIEANRLDEEISAGMTAMDIMNLESGKDTPGKKFMTDEFIQVYSFYALCSSYYSEDLVNDIYAAENMETANGENAGADFINNKCDELMNILKAAVADYPVKFQKHIRRLFFKNITLNIYPDEIRTILDYSLTGINSDAEKITIKVAIEELFAENDFEIEDEEDEHIDGFDDYDECDDDCDCDHDHHHHHNH